MNTDGMISCFDCTSQLVSIGLEMKKEKRDESYALGKITSGTGLHSFLITFFWFLFVSGGITQAAGELSEGNTDINLP